MSPGELIAEGGLLSPDQMNEGGDTEILPLSERVLPPLAADITDTMLLTELDTAGPQAAEANFSQDENKEVEAGSFSGLDSAKIELPVEITATCSDPQGSGPREVAAVGKLEEDVALDETPLEYEQAHARRDSDNDSPSSVESLSNEEGVSSPDGEEGGQDATTQADQLLDGQAMELEKERQDVLGYENPQQQQPDKADTEAGNAELAMQGGETAVLRSQLAKARRHVKLYYTKVNYACTSPADLHLHFEIVLAG